jgi:hypothetical protein
MRQDGGRMRLPVREQRAARIAAIDEVIERFRTARGDDELAWVCLPHLIIRMRLPPIGSHRAEPVSERRAAKLIEREKRQPTRETTLAGGHLLFAFTDNQRRALEPVARLLGPERDAPPPTEDDRVDQWLRWGIDLAAELIAASGGVLPVERRTVYWLILRAARDLAFFEALVAEVEPRSVVIGSTQSSASRALALAARNAGVPSVYVPHAPAIAEARLADLPTDAAGLRGPLEIKHYEAAGASPAGMEPIGNPGVEAPDESPRLAGARPALALPVDDPESLELLVELTHAALGDRVVASPHPRTEVAEARRTLPGSWEIWDGRTFELLLTGPPALIQASSGTGLEGLQLGIPTIELNFPGEQPNYPFLVHPEITAVSEAGELRDAVAAAEQVTNESRDVLRAWAAGWVSASGSGAAEAGAALIERTADQGPRQTPVWDAWAGPR